MTLSISRLHVGAEGSENTLMFWMLSHCISTIRRAKVDLDKNSGEAEQCDGAAMASSTDAPAGRKPQPDAKLIEAVKRQNEREAKLSSLLGTGDAKGLKLVGGSVSEATFSDAVKENIEVFGVSKEQAVEDVVQEFRLMGMDVSDLAAKILGEQ